MQVERLESLRSTFSSVRAHNEVGVQQGAFLPSLALGFPLQVCAAAVIPHCVFSATCFCQGSVVWGCIFPGCCALAVISYFPS